MKDKTVKDLVEESIINGDLDNNSLVEIIKLCADYLNLSTVNEYHKETGISKQGIYKYRDTFKIRTFTFVIDND